jgi:hypothetical protein
MRLAPGEVIADRLEDGVVIAQRVEASQDRLEAERQSGHPGEQIDGWVAVA